MESNPAMLGGSLTSKPTWSDTSGCSAASAFFVLGSAKIGLTLYYSVVF